MQAIVEGLLRQAIQDGDGPTVHLLLHERYPSGAHFHVHDYDSGFELFTALQHSLYFGDFQIADMLLRAGANVIEEERELETCLLLLAIRGGNLGRAFSTYKDWLRAHPLEFTKESRTFVDPEMLYRQRDRSITSFRSPERRDDPAMNKISLVQIVERLIAAGATLGAKFPGSNLLECQIEGQSLVCTPLSEALRYFNHDVANVLLMRESSLRQNNISASMALGEHIRTALSDAFLAAGYPLHASASPGRLLDFAHPRRVFFPSMDITIMMCLDFGAGQAMELYPRLLELFTRDDDDYCYLISTSNCPTFLDLAATLGNATLVKRLIAGQVLITANTYQGALWNASNDVLRILLSHSVIELTWTGMKLLLNDKLKTEIVIEHITCHIPNTATKRLLFIGSMMYDMWDLFVKTREWDLTRILTTFDTKECLGLHGQDSRQAQITSLSEDEDGFSDNSEAGNQEWRRYREDCYYTKGFGRTCRDPCQFDFEFAEAMAYSATYTKQLVLSAVVRNELLPKVIVVPYLGLALYEVIKLYPDVNDESMDELDATSTSEDILRSSKKIDALSLTLVARIHGLINLGADVNQPIWWGQHCLKGGPLVCAISAGYDSLIKAILEAGADIYALGLRGGLHHDDYPISPLSAAFMQKNDFWAKYLSSQGATEFLVPPIKETGLHFRDNFWKQCDDQYSDTFNFLLHNGPDAPRSSPMRVNLSDPKLQFWLVLLGEQIRREERISLLVVAIKQTQIQAVKLILDQNVVDKYHWYKHKYHQYSRCFTPLGLALYKYSRDREKYAIVNSLVKSDVALSMPCERQHARGLLPLFLANNPSTSEVVDLLLEAGASPDHMIIGEDQSMAEWTPLHNAVWEGSDMIVLMLLKHKANPNVAIKFGKSENDEVCQICFNENGYFQGCDECITISTPLQIACNEGYQAIAEILLDHGADVNIPAEDDAGATALQYAAMKGHLGIALLLIEYHADVNAPGAKYDGRTALEGAAEHGRLDMVQLLLNAGAKIHDSGQMQYERALNYASENGHHALHSLLEERWMAIFIDEGAITELGPG